MKQTATEGLVMGRGYSGLAEQVGQLVEIVGIAILVIGGVVTLILAVREAVAGRDVYRASRRTFGRSLLLALEVLVAADIVQTVAVELTFESVGTLGLLVAVRTVLSLSLGAELEGVLPWRRAELEARLHTEAPQPVPSPGTAAPDAP